MTPDTMIEGATVRFAPVGTTPDEAGWADLGTVDSFEIEQVIDKEIERKVKALSIPRQVLQFTTVDEEVARRYIFPMDHWQASFIRLSPGIVEFTLALGRMSGQLSRLFYGLPPERKVDSARRRRMERDKLRVQRRAARRNPTGLGRGWHELGWTVYDEPHGFR